jgi:hypothetical protein
MNGIFSTLSRLLRVQTLFYLCALFVLNAFQPVFAVDEPYQLTDKLGRPLNAFILEYTDSNVRLRRVSDRQVFTIDLDQLSDADQLYLKEHFADSKADADQTLLVPGETLLLDFPELESMAKGQPAQCEVSIPKNYSPSRAVPLFVWYSGGAGSHLTKGARGLVDFDKFVVVALPYPAGQLPRLAVDGGTIDAFWGYQKPMLDRVIELIPNLSKKVRIVGGSSSGAHMVGSGLDCKWKGFADYFTAYVLHEGGHCPDMMFMGARTSHRILIVYGAASSARGWQDYFMARIDQCRGLITYREIENAKHGLNGHGKEAIHRWIDEQILSLL